MRLKPQLEGVLNMAITETPRRSSLLIRLDAGRTSAGNVIIKNCSLPRVLAAADKDKLYTICLSVAACLEFPLLRVERVETSTIEDM